MANEHHGDSTQLGGRLSWLIALLPLALTIYFISQIPAVAHAPQTLTIAWMPSLGVELSFYLDGLSLLFALLICGIGTLIVIYGGHYLADDANVKRFYVILLSFMFAMLGLVLADNLILLFVFWELTSLTSYLLIGYKSTSPTARAAALRALLVTGAGGLALMAGLVSVGILTQGWQISSLSAQHDLLTASPLYGGVLALILLGAFTKSAQVPLHFWLPGAMEAPTPVSAYLHSATMVKAGVYLLARLNPTLGGTSAWTTVLTVVGGITMLVGAYLALKQLDLKRILAFSTISSLGTLVFLIGIGTKTAIEAAVLFLIVHSLYKGALFMAAGSVDHGTGTRNIQLLSGLRHTMPLTLIGTALAALSMAGIPPLLGFISKELQYEATLETTFAVGLTAIAIITNICMVAVAGMVTLKPFFGITSESSSHAHESPLGMWLGPLLLGVLALGSALLAESFGELLIAPASSAVYGSEVELHLHLLPSEITPMLVLSIITVAAGIGLFGVYARFRENTKWLDSTWINPTYHFDRFITALPNIARTLTGFVQHGYLRYYVITVALVTSFLVGITLVTKGAWADILPRELDVLFHEALLVLIIFIAAFTALRTRSRLVAVATLGVVGYSIALIFLLFGAPDLAMTQFTIETLSVILFVLVISRLPRYGQYSIQRARARDAVFAVTVGLLITVLVLLVTLEPLETPVSDYYAQHSYTEAQGHNVVNVILVDFRGFDTMGEISVLSIAALGVFALLKLVPRKSESETSGEQPTLTETSEMSASRREQQSL